MAIAMIMLLMTPIYKDEQTDDNDDRTVATQEIKDEKQNCLMMKLTLTVQLILLLTGGGRQA